MSYFAWALSSPNIYPFFFFFHFRSLSWKLLMEVKIRDNIMFIFYKLLFLIFPHLLFSFFAHHKINCFVFPLIIQTLLFFFMIFVKRKKDDHSLLAMAGFFFSVTRSSDWDSCVSNVAPHKLFAIIYRSNTK